MIQQLGRSRRMVRVAAKTISVVAGPVVALVLFTGSAQADFRLCNNTTSRVGVAIGYKDAKGWTTEGWWNLAPRSCDTFLRGSLAARYYYIYAIDYDRGGEWSGQAYMCTRAKEFTIRGTENCLARGYDRTGFFEIDTSEQRAWTVQLTDSVDQASAHNGSAPPSIPKAASEARSPAAGQPARRSKTQ